MVSGDAQTARAIGELLAARGIAAPAAACPAVHARVERTADAIVVHRDDPEAGADVARTVDAAATAATVIESWARLDLEAPLLEERPVALEPAPRAIATPWIDEPPVRAEPASSRGVQLFATAQASRASDGTRWAGAELGACVTLGPICAAARLRVASVTDGPGAWSNGLERRATDLLIGGDVPLRLGRAIVSPGFGGGVGTTHTRVDNAGWHMGSETGGLRADAHVAVSFAITRRIALDLSIAIELTQATHVETQSPMPLPDDPLLIGHVGLGLRYGGL